jgi:hypothetical protein
MDFIKLNVHACAGGWCTRERQHRRWRNGQPWASGSSGWWTFLRRRWARGRYACRDALRSRRGDGLSQDFHTKLAKSQASLGNFGLSRAPSESSRQTNQPHDQVRQPFVLIIFSVKMVLRIAGLVSSVARGRILTNWSCGRQGGICQARPSMTLCGYSSVAPMISAYIH